MDRKRLRELGITIGQLPTGEKNCITDVSGVHVGHETLYEPLEDDEYIATGVTAILPHNRNLFREKVAAASYIVNGFGKTTGLVQLEELGRLESPIMLTNTFGVPAVTHGTLEYMLEKTPEIGDTTGTINVVVGECNDGYLNAVRNLSVQPNHAKQAIENATPNKVAEGAVGAGTGMVCFEYKGGIGTSSRLIKDAHAKDHYTLGCLVLSNFGKQEELMRHSIIASEAKNKKAASHKNMDGSIMIVLATDMPLNERQLKRMAKRASVGLGRAGSNIAHRSGDIVIAFSTAPTTSHDNKEQLEQVVQLREDHPLMNELFTGVAEATEEAILNSLTKATTTKGRKQRTVEALPYEFMQK